MLAVIVSGTILIAGGLTFEGNSLTVNMILLTVSGAALYGSQPVLWAIPADILPVRVAGTVMGVINGLGVLGAFLGPYVVGFARGLTGSFSTALLLLGGCLLITGLLVSQVRTPVRARTAMT